MFIRGALKWPGQVPRCEMSRKWRPKSRSRSRKNCPCRRLETPAARSPRRAIPRGAARHGRAIRSGTVEIVVPAQTTSRSEFDAGHGPAAGSTPHPATGCRPRAGAPWSRAASRRARTSAAPGAAANPHPARPWTCPLRVGWRKSRGRLAASCRSGAVRLFPRHGRRAADGGHEETLVHLGDLAVVHAVEISRGITSLAAGGRSARPRARAGRAGAAGPSGLP